MRTVQGVLQDAALRVMKQPLFVQGASRTDSGVHALGQTACFDADTPIPISRMPDALNSRLPLDMEIRAVSITHDDFDPVRNARNKQYRYTIWDSAKRPLTMRNVVHARRGRVNLDVDKMNAAGKLLLGEHDFEAFSAADHNRTTTVRKVYRCDVERDPTFPELVHIYVQGNGFLYNMVRIIAGTLTEVGRGHWEPQYMQTLLSECKRELAGPTLPPTGLCLQWIEYANDETRTESHLPDEDRNTVKCTKDETECDSERVNG